MRTVATKGGALTGGFSRATTDAVLGRVKFVASRRLSDSKAASNQRLVIRRKAMMAGVIVEIARTCLRGRGGWKEGRRKPTTNESVTYRTLTSSVGSIYRMSEDSDGVLYSCLEELSGSVSGPTIHGDEWLAKSERLPDWEHIK
jgi:hypothetical protein